MRQMAAIEPVAPHPAQLGLAPGQERQVRPGLIEGAWAWNGQRCRYLRSGDAGPAVVCVHGFAAAADHWAHNLPYLGAHGCRAWALDLLGFGWTDRPDPACFRRHHCAAPAPATAASRAARESNLSCQPAHEGNLYCFHTWSRQLRAFLRQVVGEPAVLVCNSAGGEVGLQAAIEEPALVLGVQLLDVSLRRQHVAKQAPWQRPLVAGLQRLLRDTPAGRWYFCRLVTKENIRAVLRSCYGQSEAVTDELVAALLAPARLRGAPAAFLDCISNSSGPLPEEQLQAVQVPVGIVWGEADPWEPVELGRGLARYPSVESFASLPGVGHCPQDEAADVVNPLLLDFVQRHAQPQWGAPA